jgi:hypothetical protein
MKMSDRGEKPPRPGPRPGAPESGVPAPWQPCIFYTISEACDEFQLTLEFSKSRGESFEFLKSRGLVILTTGHSVHLTPTHHN